MVVHDCLFNIFAATLHIGCHSSIRNLTLHHAVITDPLIMASEYTGVPIYMRQEGPPHPNFTSHLHTCKELEMFLETNQPPHHSKTEFQNACFTYWSHTSMHSRINLLVSVITKQAASKYVFGLQDLNCYRGISMTRFHVYIYEGERKT
jgi:hypothetical protein